MEQVQGLWDLMCIHLLIFSVSEKKIQNSKYKINNANECFQIRKYIAIT